MGRTIVLLTTGALAVLLASAAALMAVVAVPEEAQAAFPGQNGRIAFDSFRNNQGDVYSVLPDGTGERNLTPDPNFAGNYPAYSADGKKIVYQGVRNDVAPPVGPPDIFVVDASGSAEPTRLTDTSGSGERGPTWSPDGTKIAFYSDRDGNDEIYVMDADGTNTRRLTFDAAYDDSSPAWSPDGTKIAFSSFRDGSAASADIWVMNTDGTNQKNLTSSPDRPDFQPSWSPDGTKIAFDTNQFGGDVWVMDADGTHQRNLTPTTFAGEYEPAWSPNGRKIAYARKSRIPGQGTDIYKMRASDGLGRVNVTDTPAITEGGPDWGPAPAP